MREGTPVRTCCRPRHAWLVLVLMAIAGANGCSVFQGVHDYLEYNDTMNDFVLGYRNSVWARQAWHERKTQFCDQPQFYDFGVGFRDGYASVASGGNGCPPPLPPRQYWNWKYQSPEGQAKVAAWFAGYPFGAKAAEEDGAGLYQQIQVSYPIERQYSPEFQTSAAQGTPGQPGLPNEYVPAAAPVERPANAGVPWYQSSQLDAAGQAPLAYDSTRLGNEDPGTGKVAAASYSRPSGLAGAVQIPSFVPIRTPVPKRD